MPARIAANEWNSSEKEKKNEQDSEKDQKKKDHLLVNSNASCSAVQEGEMETLTLVMLRQH